FQSVVQGTTAPGQAGKWQGRAPEKLAPLPEQRSDQGCQKDSTPPPISKHEAGFARPSRPRLAQRFPLVRLQCRRDKQIPRATFHTQEKETRTRKPRRRKDETRQSTR